MRSQTLPKVGVFSMRLSSVQWLLMPKSCAVKAYLSKSELSTLHVPKKEPLLCSWQVSSKPL